MAHRNGERKREDKTFGHEDDRDDKATAIVYKDDHTKMIFGHVCERKGASDTWVIEKIKEDIAILGDGEPGVGTSAGKCDTCPRSTLRNPALTSV